MEQQPLVSVIIPEVEDDTYLVRCINSIKRQTYKNVEIIVVSDSPHLALLQDNIKIVFTPSTVNWSEKIKASVSKASGSYLFFCRATSIPAPNTLNDLLQAYIENPEILHMANYVGKVDKQYSYIPEVELTLYGKILKKEKMDQLIKNSLTFSKFLEEFKAVRLETSIYIYDDFASEISNKLSEGLPLDKFIDFISSPACKLVNISGVKKISFLYMENSSISEKIWRLLYSIKKCFSSDLEWNYTAIQTVIFPLYKQCLENADNKLFIELKEYFKLWKGNDSFLQLCFEKMGNKEAIQFFFSCNSINDFIFYFSNCDSETKKADLFNLEKRIKHLEEKMNTLQKAVTPQKSQRSDIKLPQPVTPPETHLDGPVLAQFVINKYASGNLGLKTIVLSFSKWLKYKVKGRKH